MGRSCTQCGETLSLWDHMKGRIDHQRCWERNIGQPSDAVETLNLQMPKENVLFRLAQIVFSGARTSR